MVEEGNGLPSKVAEPQRGAKAAKTIHTRSSSERSMVERGLDRQVKVPAWNPPFGARQNSPSHECLYKGLPTREGRVCGQCCGVGPFKETRGVSQFKEGPCPSKSFTWLSFT